MISRYRYSQVNINEHNYLGFNAGTDIIKDSTQDRLFNVPVNYTYTTEQDNGITRDVYTYNKYHLLIYDQQISDRTNHILSETQYLFCRTDKDNGCAHTPFDNLPVTYSLPLKIVTTVWNKETNQSLKTTVIVKYDFYGRAVWKKDAYGRVTVIHYCPVTGNTACPPAPEPWFFSTLTESVTLYPAHVKINESPVYPTTTYNYYKKENNYNGKGYMLMLDHQVQQAGIKQLITASYYYHDTDNLLTYGLLKQTVLTDNQSKTTSVIKDYYYIKSLDNHTKMTYSAIELSSDKRQFSSYTTTSLFTNQVLEESDAKRKNIIHYYYDEWDRPIKTISAAGTIFAASVYYSYIVSPTLNQVLLTAPNGLQQKIIFDGAGRALMHFSEAINANGKRQYGRWLPIQKNIYDQYGRIAKRSGYNIDAVGNAEAVNITQDYDDTGRVIHVYLPDGGVSFTDYDDVDRCVISYQKNKKGEYSVTAVARANVLNKPVKQWILPSSINPQRYSVRSLCLDSDKRPVARISAITYDGFGRKVLIKDPAGKIIRLHYDALGRLTDTINPVGDRVHQVYNMTGQVVQTWAYPVSGGRYLLSSADYNTAGQLRWNAGEDGKQTFYTYTENGKLAMVTTPAKHIFTWKYNILDLPVSQFTDNKNQWSCSYDPVTLKLQSKTDNTGTTNYTYSDDGLLQTLVHKGKNSYSNYQLQWLYDNNRRIISRTDISGNKIQNSYDSLNRISAVKYLPKDKSSAETIFKPFYDSFSRIHSVDYGGQIYRIIHYDIWGNKEQITDIQATQLISQWRFHYDINGNISLLKQTAEKNKYSLLRYRYDALDNLTQMTCNGSSGLPLCPRETAFSGSEMAQPPVITRQDYTFTSLNRISAVRETLQNIQQHKMINKVINYLYNNTSVPLRLQQINTAWNQYHTAINNFTYDKSGNMRVDGGGNYITYNAMNEITKVISAAGKQSDYIYDGSGRQVMEKSSAGVSYLFYSGSNLINEKIISPGENSHITGYLGVAKTTDGLISEYYESSYKGDITGVLKRQSTGRHYQLAERNIYSPYGMVWCSNTTVKSLYQQTLHGFDGERTDPATKWQFLGEGHRTYNPQQRYFVSEDPIGSGYAFGSNNPVMNTDPSGNSPEWLGAIFKWTGYISTLGLSALNKRWANITAAFIQAGLTIAGMGATVASAGSFVLGGVVAGTAAVGSVSVVAAALPANKGLNIAGSIIGMTEMAVAAVATAGSFFAGFCGAVNETELSTVPFRMLKAKSSEWVGPSGSASLEDSCIGANTYFLVDPSLFRLESTADAIFKSLYSGQIQTYLYTKLSGFINCGKFLEISSKEQIMGIWKVLCNSPFNDNIACDTGAILLAAYFNERLIDVEVLTDFLVERKPYADINEVFSSDHPYIHALRKILYSITTRRRVYNNISYHRNVNILSSRDGHAAIISGGDGHIAVVKKNGPKDKYQWSVYQFDGDNLLLNHTCNNYKQFFLNSKTGRIVINGYMRIGSKDMPAL